MSEHEQLSFATGSETNDKPVVCLGLTFKNDDERREYFQEELRKKLPELKQTEGFPIGKDEDIIALSDPPYYTACPNPWVNDLIKKDTMKDNIEKQVTPYVLDVIEGKSDPLYNAHSYHTKVPHKAIMHLILHYTNPGDIIYDGFGGTGMTGVAASLCGNEKEIESLGYKITKDGTILKQSDSSWIPFSKVGTRVAFINDLSPIATFISSNYNVRNKSDLFSVQKIISEYQKKYEMLYVTSTPNLSKEDIDSLCEDFSNCNSLTEFIKLSEFHLSNGNLCLTNYTILSDNYICNNCSADFNYWEEAINHEDLSLRESYKCPSCGITLSKKNTTRSFSYSHDSILGESIKVIERAPAAVNYFNNNKKYTKPANILDKILYKKIQQFQSEITVPLTEIPMGDKTAEVKKIGLNYVHQFYTTRNLFVLSELWKVSHSNHLLKLALTSIMVKTASILHNVGLKNGKINLAGALPNAFYVPSIIAERNIFTLLNGKVDDFIRADLNRIQSNNIVSTHSSTSDNFYESLKDSIDYIFIDPPFGANLMYSELNYIWESWLGVKTNNKTEAIENKTQSKTLGDYQELMRKAFSNAYFILKPNKWITVEFSSTKATVWNVIQRALQEAGFVIANVSALNKGQGTYNAQTNPTSVKQDLIISAYKPDENNITIDSNDSSLQSESVWNFVRSHLKNLPLYQGADLKCEYIVERSPRIIYDRMISYFFQRGMEIPLSSSEFQAGISNRFSIRDGMAFLDFQAVEYDKKRHAFNNIAQVELFVSNENNAIEWLRQQLLNKPQTRQDLHPLFTKELSHIDKHEIIPELDALLVQNFLRYDNEPEVPSQIVSYFRRNYPDLRGLEPTDEKIKHKAMNRWYVPDPNKQADLEKLREKSLLREFNLYVDEMTKSKKKLKEFRTEAIRAGFKKAWSEKDYQTIVDVGNRLPEIVIQEDDKLLMYFDNAQIKLGL